MYNTVKLHVIVYENKYNNSLTKRIRRLLNKRSFSFMPDYNHPDIHKMMRKIPRTPYWSDLELDYSIPSNYIYGCGCKTFLFHYYKDGSKIKFKILN